MGGGLGCDTTCIDDWFLYIAAVLLGFSSGLQRAGMVRQVLKTSPW